jgi:ADP-dependent NAD(P)H-hydrate dehydratase / NAD(P)H-hydrate epimerase
MDLYSAAQLKARDVFTIKKLGITSFELMTKAAKALSKEIIKLIPNQDMPIHIFCGNGNNGGDGMLIAKQLRNEFLNVTVYECPIAEADSFDYSLAQQEAKSVSNINFILLDKEKEFPKLTKGIVIDALLGSGVNRPLQGYAKSIVAFINDLNLPIISIDLPSGMPVEGILQDTCIKATYTLTVEDMKSSFFYEENNGFLGKIVEVAIGLSKDFTAICTDKCINSALISPYFVPRHTFSHKGDYGHALLICGSKGMAGAAILSGASALRSGVGLVTLCVDEDINDIIQISLPEAMTENNVVNLDLKKYTSIGIGCGLGKTKGAEAKIDFILNEIEIPLIIDADGLNIIAAQNWQKRIPENAILTPHPKEFDRLFGIHTSHFERCQSQKKASVEYGINIVLKTAHTSVSTPEGNLYFNTTGNAGMAKAGSGDVLTGYVSGLSSLLRNQQKAALAGVYLHGQAGDKARQIYGERGMKSGDIVGQMID